MKSKLTTLLVALIPGVALCNHSNLMKNEMTNPILFKKQAELRELGSVSRVALAFSPDGMYLASRQEGRDIAVWKWRNEKIERVLKIPKGANDTLVSTRVLFSPDGKYLAACHSRATQTNTVISIWDTKTWLPLKGIVDDSMGAGCSAIAFSPSGDRLIRLTFRPLHSDKHELVEYDTTSWDALSGTTLAQSMPRAMAISHDGSKLAIVGIDTSATVTPGTNENKNRLAVEPRSVITIIDRKTHAETLTVPIHLTASSFTRLAWHPNNNLVTIAAGKGLETLDVATKEVVTNILPTLQQATVSLEVIGKTGYVVEGYGGEEGYLRVWDIINNKLISTARANVSTMAKSVDGTTIAVASQKTIEIFKIQ